MGQCAALRAISGIIYWFQICESDFICVNQILRLISRNNGSFDSIL